MWLSTNKTQLNTLMAPLVPSGRFEHEIFEPLAIAVLSTTTNSGQNEAHRGDIRCSPTQTLSDVIKSCARLFGAISLRTDEVERLPEHTVKCSNSLDELYHI